MVVLSMPMIIPRVKQRSDRPTNLEPLLVNHTYRRTLGYYVSAVVTSIAALLLLMLVFWLLFHRAYSSTRPFDFKVNSLRVSSLMIVSSKATDLGADFFTSSNTVNFDPHRYYYFMTADFNVTLSLTTKSSIFYESLAVSVEHGGQALSSTILEPFNRKEGHHENMDVGASVRAVRVSNTTAEDISKGLAMEKALEFVVNIRGYYRGLDAGVRRLAKLACEGIMIEYFPSKNATGDMIGPPVHCSGVYY